MVRRIATAAIALAALCSTAAGARQSEHFTIEVVDADTGRGVPCVELRTVSNARFFTDSAGVVAFNEPGLMGEEVFFEVKSHGYEEPGADGFGIRGVRLRATAGQSATVKLKRVNIAERLYRITGEGIYRDSVLAGLPVPLKHGVLNGKVVGQDTVFMAPYRGKLFWLWGDTNRPSYPLGNFATSSATSLLPGKGGLDPSVGIDFTYFTERDGFSKKMCPLPEPGVVWMASLAAVPDDRGRERLMGRWARLEGLGNLKERGFAVFDDSKEIFEKVSTFEKDQHVIPDSQAYRDARPGGDRSRVYFVAPYPTVRIAAKMSAFMRPDEFEGFSCLTPGSRFRGAGTTVQRDGAGRLVWAWKRNTSPLRDEEWEELVRAKIVRQDEAWNWITDATSGAHVTNHTAAIGYSEYRRRYFMILCQSGGDSSYLGEVWYTEAERLEGPWRKAVKIVTHKKYTFYNVMHHPVFDQQRGRLVYFEGTYCSTFSGNEDRTPRYEYNQMMYRLDLADARLRVVE